MEVIRVIENGVVWRFNFLLRDCEVRFVSMLASEVVEEELVLLTGIRIIQGDTSLGAP